MSKKVISQVCFKLTGDYMTFISRDMVMSGMWYEALNILKDGLIGISLEQCISILDGSHKLIGDSSIGMDLVADSEDNEDTAKYIAATVFQYARRFRPPGTGLVFEPYAIVTGYSQCDINGPASWYRIGEGKFISRPARSSDGFVGSRSQDSDSSYARAMWYARDPDHDRAYLVEYPDPKLQNVKREYAVLFRPVTTTTPFWIKECRTAQESVDRCVESGYHLTSMDGCDIERRCEGPLSRTNIAKRRTQIDDNTEEGALDFLDALIPEELKGVAKGLKAHINNTQDWDSIPQVSKHTDFSSGYIDREGRFYGCEYMAHAALGTRILKHVFKEDNVEDPEKALDKRGFVRLQTSAGDATIAVMCEKKPTKKQVNAIFDHSEVYGVWIENTSKFIEEGGYSTISKK